MTPWQSPKPFEVNIVPINASMVRHPKFGEGEKGLGKQIGKLSEKHF
jgi:hypothetical protein